jgi:hypothetical protein
MRLRGIFIPARSGKWELLEFSNSENIVPFQKAPRKNNLQTTNAIPQGDGPLHIFRQKAHR